MTDCEQTVHAHLDEATVLTGRAFDADAAAATARGLPLSLVQVLMCLLVYSGRLLDSFFCLLSLVLYYICTRETGHCNFTCGQCARILLRRVRVSEHASDDHGRLTCSSLLLGPTLFLCLQSFSSSSCRARSCSSRVFVC